MRIIGIITVLILWTGVSISQTKWTHGHLTVSPDGHSLMNENGQPFFWLGDTGWELFHRLTKEEITTYIDNRYKKGFNVIQAVALAEFSGLTKPTRYGDLPLTDLDPTKPNAKYFELIDWTARQLLDKNMFLGLLPTWGDKVTKYWGEGPVVFNEKNAYSYGLYLGKRYASYPNIIWILGGDRQAKDDTADWRPVWRAMAKGIKDGTTSKAIITYHISGGEHSTSYDLHNESWLDINMMQSSHGSGHDVPVWLWIARDFGLRPVKPTLDAEPNYEDHPVNPWPKWDSANGYFNDYDVRKQCYRSVFAGACGVTYGHHAVWQFWSAREEKINHADRYWTEAIDRPGAFQVGYLKNLMESRPFLGRVPDQSLILAGQGEKGEYATAFRDAKGTYIMVYLPVGKQVEIGTSSIKGKELIVSWYNPKTGKVDQTSMVSNSAKITVASPLMGTGNDWVLVIDDAALNYGKPGKLN